MYQNKSLFYCSMSTKLQVFNAQTIRYLLPML